MQALENIGGRAAWLPSHVRGYDAVVTVEAPDDEAYAKFALNIAAQGNARTTTLKAFTEEESFRILGNLS